MAGYIEICEFSLVKIIRWTQGGEREVFSVISEEQ